ncbi:F0F1 ATP synthase subunit A [Candidatus Gracilibacteria bacterium]|nr:F0F1 ATP synthase subunit A [Candidatus Gracilibacteria bacterium]
MAANGPHIPLIQGETVWGPITNITVTLFVFLLLVTLLAYFANKALRTHKKSKLKTGLLNFLSFFDTYLRDAFGGDKAFTRKYFPLIVGMFCIIFFGNLFGLLIDWVGLSISEKVLYYLRPMHSDVNTTLVLGSMVVAYVIFIQIKSHGGFDTAKSYLWNFRGANIGEKLVNVFVGWLHLIGLNAMIASLSLRLFGNIFAGVVLIGVITFLGAMASASLFEVGRLFAIPFWFFELFVALIQAVVFTGLMIAYFKNSKEAH